MGEPRHVLRYNPDSDITIGTGLRGDSGWKGIQFTIYLDQGVIAFERGLIAGLSGLPQDLFDRAIIGKVLHSYGITSVLPWNGWNGGKGIGLSHYSTVVDGLLLEKKEKVLLQRKFLVAHKTAPSNEPPIIAALRSTDWRLNALRGIPQMRLLGNFAEQLASYGLTLANSVEPETLVSSVKWVNSWFRDFRTTFKRPAVDIEAELLRAVPDAENYLTNQTCRFRHDDKQESLSLKDLAIGIWKWSVGSREFWLVQTVCQDDKFVAFDRLYLLERDGTGNSRVADLLVGSYSGEDQALPWGDTLRVRPILVNSRWLLVSSAAGRAIGLLDLESASAMRLFQGLDDFVARADKTFLTADNRFLVALASDGRFTVYRTADAKIDNSPDVVQKQAIRTPELISGRWIDDEILFYTKAGYYSGSYEAGNFVHVRFAGLPGLYRLQQFARTLERPDLIKAILEERSEPEPVLHLPAPPTLEVAMINADDHSLTLSYKVRSPEHLQSICVFQDGKPTDEIAVYGAAEERTVEIPRFAHTRRITFVALDVHGLESSPATIEVPISALKETTLHMLAVGIDRYDEPAFSTLNFAKSDATSMTAAAKATERRYYTRVQSTELINAAASAGAVLKLLEEKVASAKVNDTILFFFAGHGIREGGRFYMASSDTRLGNIAGTALDWAKVTDVLARSQARVVVVLDACHSGHTGEQAIATNDDAIGYLAGKGRSPILVLAATKGRQESEKSPLIGGGVFTRILVDVMTKARQSVDTNRNGLIELSELYAAVKARVQTATRGRQTPWIVRQGMVGDFPLF